MQTDRQAWRRMTYFAWEASGTSVALINGRIHRADCPRVTGNVVDIHRLRQGGGIFIAVNSASNDVNCVRISICSQNIQEFLNLLNWKQTTQHKSQLVAALSGSVGNYVLESWQLQIDWVGGTYCPREWGRTGTAVRAWGPWRYKCATLGRTWALGWARCHWRPLHRRCTRTRPLQRLSDPSVPLCG